MTLHILRTPMREYKRVPYKFCWCFACRQRLMHYDVMYVSTLPPEDDWYGPHWAIECDRCKKDRTQFPRGEWP